MYTLFLPFAFPPYPCLVPPPDSQEKIKQVKTSLKSCKSLLRCKRDELKRLWLEDVKYKHMLQMIENV